VEEPSRILSVDKAIHYSREILEGLVRLHEAGIIHRDIKPYNILITDLDQVKITDFGLSKLRGETFQGPENLMVGSPYYAAPEQEEDPNQADVRADLYPVGIMLYRMLAGELPIDAYKSLSESNPDLDSHWNDFVMKATAADRTQRFPTAEAMLDALLELQAAWEVKKDKVCEMPSFGLQRKDSPSSTETPRSEGIKIRPRQARQAFGADSRWRPARFTTNDFEVYSDGTVTDRATGLIWQRAGSNHPITWHEAHQYVKRLNEDRFAARADWRLPTVNELVSLLTDVPRAGDLCIEPVFDPTERWLWSCDRCSFMSAWYVSVDMGYISRQDFTCYYYVRAVCSGST
jgi:serine/threonine-protein kinase